MRLPKILLSALLASCMAVTATAAEKRTYIYDIAGSDTLRVDVYKGTDTTDKTPALIFAFGGSFRHGQRDDSRYLPMFRFLADNGITVVSADYRTMLSRLEPADIDGPEEFAEALTGAIQTAVLDYTRATAYIISHADEWDINQNQIFACGSSAGAITALQAEYEICNRNASIGSIPAGFNYAGVISMAGAIFSDGTPRWRRTPAPMLLFHGDADSTVPFNRATMGTFGLWGSESIAESLTALNIPNTFWKILGADHSVAITPMDNHSGAILDFIHSVCSQRATITTVEERIPGQGPYKTDFTLKDYLQSNM